MSAYTWLMLQDLHYESAKKVFRRLLDKGIYTYRALKAYIILDDTFEKTSNKRKLKWAKRYMRQHNIKFEEIQSYMDAAWKKDLNLYQEMYELLAERCPGIVAFMGHYL